MKRLNNLIFDQLATTHSIFNKVADFETVIFQKCNFFTVIFEKFYPLLFPEQRELKNFLFPDLKLKMHGFL